LRGRVLKQRAEERKVGTVRPVEYCGTKIPVVGFHHRNGGRIMWRPLKLLALGLTGALACGSVGFGLGYLYCKVQPVRLLVYRAPGPFTTSKDADNESVAFSYLIHQFHSAPLGPEIGEMEWVFTSGDGTVRKTWYEEFDGRYTAQRLADLDGDGRQEFLRYFPCTSVFVLTGSFELESRPEDRLPERSLGRLLRDSERGYYFEVDDYPPGPNSVRRFKWDRTRGFHELPEVARTGK